MAKLYHSISLNLYRSSSSFPIRDASDPGQLVRSSLKGPITRRGKGSREALYLHVMWSMTEKRRCYIGACCCPGKKDSQFVYGGRANESARGLELRLHSEIHFPPRIQFLPWPRFKPLPGQTFEKRFLLQLLYLYRASKLLRLWDRNISTRACPKPANSPSASEASIEWVQIRRS